MRPTLPEGKGNMAKNKNQYKLRITGVGLRDQQSTGGVKLKNNGKKKEAPPKPYAINIRFDIDIARPLRIVSIDTGKSINEIVNNAVRDWLADKMLIPKL